MIDQNTAYFWVHEYRKFLVLAALFTEIIPSTRILHVWKTHMSLNTPNYRQCVTKIKCKEKLFKIPFYTVEDYTAYSTTLACYKIIFNEEAPEIVWEQPSTRFDFKNHIYIQLYKLCALYGMNKSSKNFLNEKSFTQKKDKNLVLKMNIRKKM